MNNVLSVSLSLVNWSAANVGISNSYVTLGIDVTMRGVSYNFVTNGLHRGATYDVHLRLIGKRVVDFRLVLTELFLLDVPTEALGTNISWKSTISLLRGSVDTKFHVEGVALINHSSSHKTRPNDLSYDIKIWTDLSTIFSQSTSLSVCPSVHLSVCQTDGQTEFSSLDRVCIPCSAVIKSVHIILHISLFRTVTADDIDPTSEWNMEQCVANNVGSTYYLRF